MSPVTPTPTRPRTHRAAPAVTGAVLVQAVRARTTMVVVASLILAGFGLMVGALWPPMRESLAQMQAALPEAMLLMIAGSDMATATGWVNAEMMSITAPAVLIVVAVGSATRATAGEEEDRTLGTLLGAPVGRVEFLLAKAAATAVHVGVVAAAMAGGLLLGSVVGGMDLPLSGVLAVTVHAVALALLFGAVGLALAAATGRRRLSTSVTGALAALAFVLASFLPLSERLADGVRLSPWYYFNSSDPLGHGVDPAHLLVLLGSTAAFLLLAVAAFRRRDLRG